MSGWNDGRMVAYTVLVYNAVSSAHILLYATLNLAVMHGKSVTYLQLANKSESISITGNFVAYRIAIYLLTDWQID